jgi:hypothetical protein
MTSKFLQIKEGILIEYIYTSLLEPETHLADTYQVEILEDSENDLKYFFNTPDNDTTTFNVRDYSAVYKDDKTYVYLNRDLPLQYVDYADNLTDSDDLLVDDFPPNYEIAYDNIRIHFVSNFNFETADGYIFDISISKRDENKINLASLVYRKSDDFAILNPKPLLIGERLYTRYIDLKIPSLYFLSLEDPSANNLNAKLTDNLGLLTSSKININLFTITETNKINSYSNFTVEKESEASFNKKDEFELLVARVKESEIGDYFELYGEYDGKIFEDFINLLNAQPDSDYAVFHEITVNEQIGETFTETARKIILQTGDFEKPMKYRPIIENSSNAVAYSIGYVLRLINKVDNLQILKNSQLISYDTKKYGRSLKKLYLPTPPVVSKIYNKVENVSYDTSAGSIRDKLVTTNIVKPEYINVFNDRLNLVTSYTKIDPENFENTDINTTELNYQGEAIIDISPYDNFILFNFYKKAEDNLVDLNLSVFGEIYINFNDEEEMKIKEYGQIDGLKNYQKIFKISKNESRKLQQFSNNKFYITHKIESSDGEVSDESIIYVGKFKLV